MELHEKNGLSGPATKPDNIKERMHHVCRHVSPEILQHAHSFVRRIYKSIQINNRQRIALNCSLYVFFQLID